MEDNNKILNPASTPMIREDEFSTRLSKSLNGIKIVHMALLESQGEICTILLSDALEPFLLDLYEIESRYSNYMGFKEETI